MRSCSAPRQLGCDHRYFLSPHRYPGVRVGQQVPRPRGVGGLSVVASDQEEAIAFSHVSQWYLPSLTRLSAGGGQQQQRSSDRTENRETTVASAQKLAVHRGEFAETPGTELRANKGDYRSLERRGWFMTPPHIWESIIVHSAILFTPTGDKALSRENPPDSRTVSAGSLLCRRPIPPFGSVACESLTSHR